MTYTTACIISCPVCANARPRTLTKGGMSLHTSIHMPIHISVHMSVHLSVHMSVHSLYTCLYTYVYAHICAHVHMQGRSLTARCVRASRWPRTCVALCSARLHACVCALCSDTLRPRPRPRPMRMVRLCAPCGRCGRCGGVAF